MIAGGGDIQYSFKKIAPITFQTPSKSARKSSAKAAVPSTTSVARRLILQAEDDDQEKKEEVAVAAAAAAVTPSKRGRPRKEVSRDGMKNL